MSEKKITPVLLLTGYLGSGKTTLLNRILTNERNIRFAVIVNDLGEVNIDAELIQKGGVVGGGNQDDLVALQNGCICCTLRTDLIEQLSELAADDKFDYIVIEASGICEPEPIAQTICLMPRLDPKYTEHGTPRLDCICTVVDALRLKAEFGCGDALTQEIPADEERIESLIIDQIEFCNIILLNKIDEVTKGPAASAPSSAPSSPRRKSSTRTTATCPSKICSTPAPSTSRRWPRRPHGCANSRTSTTRTTTTTSTITTGTTSIIMTMTSTMSTSIITSMSTATTTITTTMTTRARPRNTACRLSCTPAARASTSTSSTTS